MWITVFIVCFCHSAYSTAQEVTNYSSEASDGNQEVNWNNRSPVTLIIRNGRSDNINRTQDEIYGDDPTLFYSNQWRPILMPIGYNQNDELNRYQPENEYSLSNPFIPTFLRRPDSEQNATASSNPQATDNEKEPLFPTPLPMDPIMYYPNPFNFYPQDYAQPRNVQVLQNSSTLISETVTSDSVPPNSGVNPGEIVPTENFRINPYESRRLSPMDFYRNMPGFIPPRSPPYVSPYSFLPFSRDDIFQPTINRNFGGQTGFEVKQNISPEGDVPEVEKQTRPDYIPVNEAIADENVQRESSTNIVPPPPLPLPFPGAGYPFGAVPPSHFVPPLIPNVQPPLGRSVAPSLPLSRDPFFANFQPRGIPFNPLFAPFTNVPVEAPVPEAILPPPIIEANPPLEQPAPVLPPVDDLQPELDLVPTDIKVDADNVLENETPNAEKIPYEFGFDMNDGLGTDQHRKEVSDGSGVVTGSYGYRDLYGTYRLVNYIADKDGFRAFIKSNEPGVASSGSANVVVMAERPQPHAVAEGLKPTDPEAVFVADESPDLIAAASAIDSD